MFHAAGLKISNSSAPRWLRRIKWPFISVTICSPSSSYSSSSFAWLHKAGGLVNLLISFGRQLLIKDKTFVPVAFVAGVVAKTFDFRALTHHASTMTNEHVTNDIDYQMHDSNLM